MKNKFIIIALGILFMTAFNISDAYAIYEAKDSYYFMKDDGIMTEDEMDEEAQYVYEQCYKNTLQHIYFDCACIAGRFRQKREELGEIEPQAIIINEIVQGNDVSCTNTTEIAGKTYQNCLELTKVSRQKEDNNEQYCGCVGNKVANEFAKDPKLKSWHIKKLKINAMKFCRHPENMEPASGG